MAGQDSYLWRLLVRGWRRATRCGILAPAMSDQLVSPVMPFQGFREIDDFGGGGYGAPRRKDCPECEKDPRCEECEGKGYIVYPHTGLDVAGKVMDQIVLPHDARIAHVGIAYAGSDLGSIHLHGENFRTRLLYVRIASDLTKGMKAEQGDLLGTLQDVAAYHQAKSPGKRMTNHTHLDFWIKKGEAWVRTDPTPYLAASGMA